MKKSSAVKRFEAKQELEELRFREIELRDELLCNTLRQTQLCQIINPEYQLHNLKDKVKP